MRRIGNAFTAEGDVMRYLVNSREMKRYDNNTIEYFGVPSAALMERAALAVAEEIKKRFPADCGKILVLCGMGNNGGDGFAAARMLHLAGYNVEILFPMQEKKMTEEAKRQYETAKKYQTPEVLELSSEYSVIVDALFGIGLSRAVEGESARLIEEINKTEAFKIAVDIASGISADTGQILGTAFRADLTVTFGFAKTGQLLYPGAEYTGELVVADIGIDKNSFLGEKPSGRYLKKDCVKNLLPVRKSYSNKGTYGKALVIAGSARMAGAAWFAAKAAYYAGCGLVRIYTVKDNRNILLTKLPEAVLTTYEERETDFSSLDECLNWADAVLAGPGLSEGAAAHTLVSKTLLCADKKTVFDADALNILAKDMSVLKRTKGERVFTPHLGEMSRMSGKSIKEIQSDILSAAGKFAEEYRAVCVLKDARTVTYLPDGKFFLNLTGNHGMATGGSGDVLAGFLTGFLAQGLTSGQAAPLAVFLHGLAGDLAAKEKGAYGMLASDVLEMLPKAMEMGA